MLKNIIFLGLLLSLFLACSRETPNPDDNKDFPLDITLTEQGENVEISWEEVRVSNFVEYKVFRQTDSVFFSNLGTDTTWVVRDVSQTKVIDKTVPPFGKIFYRVEAVLSNRQLSSVSQSYTRKDFTGFADIQFTNITPIAVNNELYFSNTSSGIVSIGNLNTRVLRRNIDFSSTPFSASNISILPENPQILYSFGGQDAAVFDVKASERLFNVGPLGLVAPSTMVYMPGSKYVYVSISDGYNGLHIYDTEQGKYVEQSNVTFSNFASSKELRFLPNKNKLLMFDKGSSTNTEVIVYTLKPNGLLQSVTKVKKTTPMTGANLAISPDGSKILTGTSGQIYDSDLNLIGKLNTSPNSAQANYTFSPDGKYLAYRTSTGNIMVLDTEKWVELKQFNVKSVSSSLGTLFFFNFYITNSEVGLVYVRNNSLTFTRDVIVSKKKFL
jgi:hypothetical protein